MRPFLRRSRGCFVRMWRITFAREERMKTRIYTGNATHQIQFPNNSHHVSSVNSHFMLCGETLFINAPETLKIFRL